MNRVVVGERNRGKGSDIFETRQKGKKGKRTETGSGVEGGHLERGD